MNNYTNHSMEKAIARHAAAKQMIMNYPYYTDDRRNVWLDSIDGSLNVILQAHKNAHDAMEEALREYKKD